jgi:Winged helix-turn-helix DNA-binding
MLGEHHESEFTNRQLAQRLGVDPGHLHFHVRMLLKAGLIQLADNGLGHGREKPYRAVARTFRVAPELLALRGASDLQAAMIDEVQRAHALYGGTSDFRGAQTRIKLPVDRALQLMTTFLEAARDVEQEDSDKIVVTMFAHPPAAAD